MKSIALVCVLAVLFVYAVYTRKAQTADRPKGGDLAAAWDTSGSAANLNCAALIGKIRERLNDPGFRVGRDSRLAIFVTGGSAQSYTARLMTEMEIPPRSAAVLTGGGGSVGGASFYDELGNACANLPPADGSAITESIERALQYLKGRGCGEKRLCELVVGSDGIENAHPAVYKYLASPDPKEAPPLMLDNSAVHRLAYCGFGQIGESGGPRINGQLIMDRWARMFVRQPVIVQPYCAAENIASAR